MHAAFGGTLRRPPRPLKTRGTPGVQLRLSSLASSLVCVRVLPGSCFFSLFFSGLFVLIFSFFFPWGELRPPRWGLPPVVAGGVRGAPPAPPSLRCGGLGARYRSRHPAVASLRRGWFPPTSAAPPARFWQRSFSQFSVFFCRRCACGLPRPAFGGARQGSAGRNPASTLTAAKEKRCSASELRLRLGVLVGRVFLASFFVAYVSHSSSFSRVALVLGLALRPSRRASCLASSSSRSGPGCPGFRLFRS